ncbi:MAG: methyltransferase domain-containing protein, partial [Candidatus Dadabacteria bacterium]|nr:methyltransferase domain-containing protein [Candidatus Dadabacteria bacterium]
AIDINSKFYKLNNISFEHSDFFEFKFKEKYDAILCLSTFHYFEDKQKLFLEKCKQIMNENSTLIAEIGVSQKHKEKIYVE